MSDERRTASPQVAILVLAVVIAATAGAASVAGRLGSYALAWLAVNAAMVWGAEFPQARPWVFAAGVALVLAAPTLMLARRAGALADATDAHPHTDRPRGSIVPRVNNPRRVRVTAKRTARALGCRVRDPVGLLIPQGGGDGGSGQDTSFRGRFTARG